MQNFAYLWQYLFRIVLGFWTARECVMGSVFMLYSDPGQTFGSTFPLFFGYTISLSGRVFGEQRGGAVKILARIGVEQGNQPQLRILGWD